jgi:hypothetical protein
MHWITRNYNVAFSIDSRAAVSYQADEISIAQLRKRRAEMAANPPDFPDACSESGWNAGAAWIDEIIVKAREQAVA